MLHLQYQRGMRPSVRVLHVFKTYLPDSFFGIERVIWHIAQNTKHLGVQSRILTLSQNPSPGPLRVDNHLVYQARLDLDAFSTGLSLNAFRLYRRLIAATDIVHFHFPWPMMDLLHFSACTKRPAVVTYHSDIVKQQRLLPFYRPLMHRFLASADHIVATSPQYLETSETLRRYRHKTSVVPIGLDGQAPVISSGIVNYWRERVGRDFFLFVGWPRYYKGLPYLLEAARIADVNLVLAGVSPEHIQGAAGDRVAALGHVSEEDKGALLELAKAVVLPSHLRAEAYGIVLLEAARAGRPMICCDLGTGTTHVNQAGETGLVVPPADPVALANAIMKLKNDLDMATAYGRAARERFDRLFNADDMGRAYFEIYRTIGRRRNAT